MLKDKGDTVYGLRAPGDTRTDTALGWEDVRGLHEGVITRRIMDDKLPGGPVERVIEYHAPFDRCDREDDYRTAWAAFTQRWNGRTGRVAPRRLFLRTEHGRWMRRPWI